ncbi:glycoside hydrolase family 63 protein [Gonapodya prolifera JEL478]|uniref:Mannosyl-oligosaccharide glucosidase n=1 Tax=Gonapodya prolifera (strain JEL478) TaxID=1344416 RepID=A0A139AB59_GONPJ|nr:glycoside hydrolase family 63 protein [Gonapodya prolifera JEL478]|eukprot:KXS13948.1 glycoside hydrolase family 63 protein [Gonapodya prolifera JEL478]
MSMSPTTRHRRLGGIAALIFIILGACDGFSTPIDPALPAHNRSLLHGTYLPNLYFGTKSRVANGVRTGLMWFGVGEGNYNGLHNIRHTSEQDDKRGSYGWELHDGRTFGSQWMDDHENNAKLRTDFVKFHESGQTGDWGARITGSNIRPSEEAKVSVIYYVALEGEGTLRLQSKDFQQDPEVPAVFEGVTPTLGSFTLSIFDSIDNQPPYEAESDQDESADLPDINQAHFLGKRIDPAAAWEARSFAQQELADNAQSILSGMSLTSESKPPQPGFLLSLPDTEEEGANIYFFQITVKAPFELNAVLLNGPSAVERSAETAISRRKLIPSLMDKRKLAFNRKFRTVFQLPLDIRQSHLKFAQYSLSNLLGGIGYFHGDSINIREGFGVDPPQEALVRAETRELFTAVPCRPFFPRGFLWDEGFHLLLIQAWDTSLSLDILQHWVSLFDENGWVGREQILGAEARSRVPERFIPQHPMIANPPTLVLPLLSLLDRVQSQEQEFDTQQGTPGLAATDDIEYLRHRHLKDPNLARSILRDLYTPLKRNFFWFKRTQQSTWGRTNKEVYRWWGRTDNHTMASGLDDYPRSWPPSDGEAHLDLLCWMAVYAQSLKRLAMFLGEDKDATHFSDLQSVMEQSLHDLHWDPDTGLYYDFSINEGGKLIFEKRIGYVSLFPLMLGLIPHDSERLGSVLEYLRDPNHLWSDFGIRSLSISDPLFGMDENYWRGPIWINMNYMILTSLKKNYAEPKGPYSELAKETYDALRSTLINNLYREYERTGFLWEQYSGSTGQGQRSRPFTGWSSLVLLMMSELYP